MPIESIPIDVISSSVVQPIESGLNYLSALVFMNLGKIAALLIVLGIGFLVAFRGKNQLTKLMKKCLKIKWIASKTGLTPQDIDKPEGWKKLLLLIPELLRFFIVFFFAMLALNILNLQEALSMLGDITAMVPNFIAVVFLLIFGAIVTKISDPWFEVDGKLFSKSPIPKLGFQAIFWTIIIAICFTQLNVGDDIIPIIIGGAMAILTVIVFCMKDFIIGYATMFSLKRDGVKVGDTLVLTKPAKIVNIGLTHIKVENDNQEIHFIKHSEWSNDFTIKHNKTETPKD